MKHFFLATTALVLAAPALAEPKASVAPPAYSWTGCSAGVHVGAGWGRSSFSDPNAPLNTLIATSGGVIDDLERSSVLGGVQAGCDYQFASHWVVGAAGDFSWTGIQGQATDPFFAGKFGGPITLTAKTDWVASATMRIGYAFDRVLLYGRGGAAWSHNTYGVQNTEVWGSPSSNLCQSPPGVFIGCNPTGTATRVGYAVGLGAEWAFAGNWVAGLEFDHYGFGSKTVMLTDPNVAPTPGSSASAPIIIKQSIETAKITFSYRFGPH